MTCSKWVFIITLPIALLACNRQVSKLNIIHSVSFPKEQVTLTSNNSVFKEIILNQESNSTQFQNNEVLRLRMMSNDIKSKTDWDSLSRAWILLNEHFDSDLDSTFEPSISVDWINLNSKLMKFSGEVCFAEAIEKMLTPTNIRFICDSTLKSIIYTHGYDQIFINQLIPSRLQHFHTTGGSISLILDQPNQNISEYTLTCECADTRFLDVLIRIPSWAVKPTVTHGLVKYVAHAGEYCEITRKWKNGDKFIIRLIN